MCQRERTIARTPGFELILTPFPKPSCGASYQLVQGFAYFGAKELTALAHFISIAPCATDNADSTESAFWVSRVCASEPEDTAKSIEQVNAARGST